MSEVPKADIPAELAGKPAAQWAVLVRGIFGWQERDRFFHRFQAEALYRKLLRDGAIAKIERLE